MVVIEGMDEIIIFKRNGFVFKMQIYDMRMERTPTYGAYGMSEANCTMKLSGSSISTEEYNKVCGLKEDYDLGEID